jgi:prevent-host-death family protein
MDMLISSSEFQNNVGRFIDLASKQEVVILRNGRPVARLVGMEKTVSFLTDKLIGVLPEGFDPDAAKAERLARQ